MAILWANIDEVETDVVEIEAKLDKLVKLCSGMIEAGRVYISANKLFVNGIRDLSHHCKKEEMISECLEKCGDSLQEIVNYHMVRHMSLRLALHGHMSHNKTYMHTFQSEVIMIHHILP
ncbi:arf-GAP with coiled-coil, ANK repeat and PH domain-containing protein 3-like [Sinocyclocheilus grahami]|uniref:arf-GAP with coiled-coil, ANK repeat and PH domain-containing protein 3-like n=1 Tax=Sinocyclocheilus grahami TaxID=75366 RepID=UPI0007AD19E2|nr:PREDICTED: arf-GAP with coiled-coil, ANK repeat and PH domain-containing protein 3-like [Sinocyclocheilus grahami]